MVTHETAVTVGPHCPRAYISLWGCGAGWAADPQEEPWCRGVVMRGASYGPTAPAAFLFCCSRIDLWMHFSYLTLT